jgi:hypothetical protein
VRWATPVFDGVYPFLVWKMQKEEYLLLGHESALTFI